MNESCYVRERSEHCYCLPWNENKMGCKWNGIESIGNFATLLLCFRFYCFRRESGMASLLLVERSVQFKRLRFRQQRETFQPGRAFHFPGTIYLQLEKHLPALSHFTPKWSSGRCSLRSGICNFAFSSFRCLQVEAVNWLRSLQRGSRWINTWKPPARHFFIISYTDFNLVSRLKPFNGFIGSFHCCAEGCRSIDKILPLAINTLGAVLIRIQGNPLVTLAGILWAVLL